MKEANFMQTPASHSQTPVVWRGARLQRKCACGGTPGASGECERCRRKRLQARLAVTGNRDAFETEADRAAESLGTGAAVAPLSPLVGESAGERPPPIVDEVIASGGQPLDDATRHLMSSHFGHHFGNVRIHADARAAESARAVQAHAYTVGNHIAFDAGRFAPTTSPGQKLLAHELAHVVQQSSGASPSVQRDDKPAAERIDVSIVFSDSDIAMREGRSYATTALRVISCADAKNKLVALGKPIGTIYVVSHANASGQIQIDSPGQTIMVKLSDCSKELKGLAQEIAPTDVDFRGCKLGEATGEMETFRQNIGAQTARAGNCWSIVQPMHPVMISGVPLTNESQIPADQKAEVDAALKTQINNLKSDDGRSVKNCLIGLAKGETADGNFAKLRQRYFLHKGQLTAGWASPELNNNWQQGSLCVKDMTATTKPCNIVTTKAAAASPPPPEKKQAAPNAP